MLGGDPVSLSKERRYSARLPSGEVQESSPARSLSFSRRKTPQMDTA
jgi:hypothetical protein